MINLLQYFLVQSQQSDRHISLLSWYSSNKNSSTVPMNHPDDVSKYFQSLQIYSTYLNPKNHTKKKPVYASTFFHHSDNLTPLKNNMSF